MASGEGQLATKEMEAGTGPVLRSRKGEEGVSMETTNDPEQLFQQNSKQTITKLFWKLMKTYVEGERKHIFLFRNYSAELSG